MLLESNHTKEHSDIITVAFSIYISNKFPHILKANADKEGSFVTVILSTASAAHCGTLWRTLLSLFLVTASASPPTAPTCKVSTSHCLYFLRYRLMTKHYYIMKLFHTSNTDIIKDCCAYFKFKLPSELIANKI